MSPYCTSNRWVAWRKKCGKHPSSSPGSSLREIFSQFSSQLWDIFGIAVFVNHFRIKYVWSFMKPLKSRTSGWRCSKGMNSMFSSNGWTGKSKISPVVDFYRCYKPQISWIFWHSLHLHHTPQTNSGGQEFEFNLKWKEEITPQEPFEWGHQWW